MQTVRVALVAVCGVVLAGSLGTTAGYAWYLRSDGYRLACAVALSESLGLPSDIGGVEPRSRRARQFNDIVVWLPERRDEAFMCRQALLVRTPTEEDRGAYELHLTEGACEISTRTWLRHDYRGVVESGLRPGFAPGGPRRVRFHKMHLLFERGDFHLRLGEAAGDVSFDLPVSGSPELGQAHVLCRVLNGFTCDEPVFLRTRFSPRAGGIRIDRLELRVPRLPVRMLNSSSAAERPIARAHDGPSTGEGPEDPAPALRSGEFGGELTYEEHDGGRRLVLAGRCYNLDLAECTAGLLKRPWRGRCPEIELHELRLENGVPARLAFRGLLSDLSLGEVLSTWSIDAAGGRATLRVGEAELSERGIGRLVASGECTGVALEPLTARFGRGRMSGTLRIVIDDLVIENNRIERFDGLVKVEDSRERPNWIEGTLLREIVRQTLKVTLPEMLPERIEYTRLGVRLQVRDEELYVFGTHGAGEKVILTVRLFERDLPLLFEPARPFDLSGWLDGLRSRAAEQIRLRLPPRPPASGPADDSLAGG
jgi:hypothetical protein